MKNLRDVTGGKGEELTNFGIQQSKAIANTLSTQINIEDCSVISSNMIQVEQTAKIIADELAIPFYVTDKLKPANMGIVNGLTRQEIQEDFPTIHAQLSLWRRCEIEACAINIPDMESPEVFWDRILTYLKSICNGGTKIIVCTRSVLVLIYNYIHKNDPRPGGGYKHVHINNCEAIASIFDTSGTPVGILGNLTSDGLT